MISKSQFQLLSHLIEKSESQVAINTLATQLDWSPGHTSRVVSELQQYGCIQTETSGRTKQITLTDIDPVEQLEGLITEYSHVDFPDVIAGAGMQILYYLTQPRTATELAERSGVSRATVYRRLEDLQRVGIVGKSKSRYQLNEPFIELSAIARGFVHQKHRREAAQYTHGVSLIWETHDEYLFACDSDVTADGFHLTGPARFADFDIPLLTRSRRHYFRSDRMQSVSPPELVCHTLLIDDSSRYRTYSLLLIQHHDIAPEILRTCAADYAVDAEIELVEIVDALLAYLGTGGETTTAQLPAWEEFKSTAADYGITV